MIKRKHAFKISIVILTAVLFLLLLFFVLSNTCLATVNYTLDTQKTNGFTIVFLSDLHGKEFGQNNSRLLAKIAKESPDIICLGGDFIDEDNTDRDNERFLCLVSELLAIAPVYYSPGNHDDMYFAENGREMLDQIEALGCQYLEEDYVDIDTDSASLRLGGLYNYAFNQQYVPDDEWKNSDTYRFLTDFTDTDRTTVLLCHRPDSFIYGNAAYLWDIDLVLCGHTHGGLWRLPLIGGLIAPEQGFNPPYDKGEFELGNITMIVSSGLSGYGKIPRLFNSPEITVITLM